MALRAAPAAADPPTEDLANPGHEELFCPLISGPSCTHTFLFDVLLDYQRDVNDSRGSKNLFRYGGELGYLIRLGSTPSQLGMVTEGGRFENDDVSAWYLASKLRLRLWPMHSVVGMELSSGPLFTWAYYEEVGARVRRSGVKVELGVTYLGAFSLVTGGDWLRSASGITSGAFFMGVRSSFVTFPWGILARM